MNELHIQTSKVSPTLYECAWAIGPNRQGVIRIHMPATPLSHPGVAAELTALHRLLVVDSVFGSDRAGNNLLLTVSFGQVRKLLARKSFASDLLPYSALMAARFGDASISVAKGPSSWFGERRFRNAVDLDLPARLDEEVLTPRLGRVRLTYHVVEQFAERANNLELHEAWRSLVRLLQGPLREFHKPEEMQLRNADLYGFEATYWHDSETKWNLVIRPGNQESLPVVLTAYYYRVRPDQFAPLLAT